MTILNGQPDYYFIVLEEIGLFQLVGIFLLSYLLGAVPFANIIAHLKAGVDLRRVGVGTVSPWSLYQAVGLWPALLAGAADVVKGAVGPLLIGADHLWLAALAGALTVAGHNWSFLAAWKGGRGLSSATGAFLVVAWPAAAVMCLGLAVGVATKRVLGAMSLALVATIPAVWYFEGWPGLVAVAMVLAPIVVKTVVLLSRGTLRPRDLLAAARRRQSERRWRWQRRRSDPSTHLDSGDVSGEDR